MHCTAPLDLQHYFTLHGPTSHLFGKDGLKICFETEELALRWRDALKDATLLRP